VGSGTDEPARYTVAVAACVFAKDGRIMEDVVPFRGMR